jgi:hypothetical protein
VKGRDLNENEVVQVCDILRRVGALFEIAVIDMATHTEEQILRHKSQQETNIVANLTSEHSAASVAGAQDLKRRLEETSLPLYVQSVLMVSVVYDALNHADTYFAFRRPQELASYHWTIDAKGRDKLTPWEEWWRRIIMPALQSETIKRPFIHVEGGDYSRHDHLRKKVPEYLKPHVRNPEGGNFMSLNPVMTEDFRFSSAPEAGLEAVDIVTNAVRRSMKGNFAPAGWRCIPQLMINRKGGCIGLTSIWGKEVDARSLPYLHVVRDFMIGGRSMLPNIEHRRS